MKLSEMNQDSYYLLCYTRLPVDETTYAPKLAYSMHLAWSENKADFQPLGHNSGVLFAKATDNSDGTMNAKSLKKPYLFYLKDGTYGVLAIRTEADGSKDESSKGSVLLFTSKDLLHYKEEGLIDLKGDTFVTDIACHYDMSQMKYIIRFRDDEGAYYQNKTSDLNPLTECSAPKKTEPFTLEEVTADIEGIVPRNVISISKETARRLAGKLLVPENDRIEVPAECQASCAEDLKKVKATAYYTDGTTASKNIDWDTSSIDWNGAGVYPITGRVHQDHFENPIAIHRADPCIGRWNGKYYFIATNDADNNHSLYIREADNIPDLVHAEEIKILDTNMYEHLGGLLWAPEFHIVRGELYIFHAGTPGEFHKEQSHVMKLKKGGNPVKAEDWEMPVRVLKKDGSYLYEDGITLDMTCFELGEDVFVVWAQRQFTPVDQGSWLYIAKVSPEEPWKLITDPVLLSKPDYGWANNHVFVDEGPFTLMINKKIFLTFASALIDETYTVGLLSADLGADLMNPMSWIKENYPILTSRSVPGEYGPGHNSYVTDEDGIVWNAYHARFGIGEPRSSGIRRVHFDIDGYPVLDLTEDKDLKKELAAVQTKVYVPEREHAGKEIYEAAVTV